jgi:threonine dehydrogenase-like Zn-dependent dehydrogenase
VKAVTWQGVHNMQVTEVPDPRIEEPTDVIIKVTSTGLCGSDLHLYEPLAPFMEPGDIVGHEPMGIVEEVGGAVTNLRPGDRVVVPFNVSCGSCWMCERKLYSQCETTQNHAHGTGASFFGYSKLYGQVPGGQAEYLRVPFGDFLPVKVPEGPADDRFLFLSDVLPTAWQGVKYADVPDGGTLLVLGAGPIGDMAARMAAHLDTASSASTGSPSAWPAWSGTAPSRSTSTRPRRAAGSPRPYASSPAAVAPTR